MIGFVWYLLVLCVCIYIYIYTHTYIHIYIKQSVFQAEIVYLKQELLQEIPMSCYSGGQIS